MHRPRAEARHQTPARRGPRRRTGAAVAALTSGALVATAIVAGVAAPASAAEPVLLSQGRTVTASSVENADYTPAAAAVDGDLGTRWSSRATDDQWIQVDLGTTSTVSRVDLAWEGAYGKAYTLQVSDDATTWRTAATVTNGDGGADSVATTGSGRYLRLQGVTRGTGYGYSLWELKVFGTPSTTTPGGGTGGTTGTCSTTNAALGRPASASSSESATYYPASAAFDGSTSSRWSSLATDAQWLQVDLGTSQHVCGVDVVWEGAYGRAYTVQVSDDATTWRTAAAVADGTGGTQTLTTDASGRYVRLAATQRGTGYGYSVWEMAVHTGAGTTDPTDPTDPADPTQPYPDYVNAGYPDVPVVAGRASRVAVTGTHGSWTLTVDGKPYTVRGMTWGPSPAEADTYMPGLVSMGANTIRTWGTGPDQKALYASAAKNDIRVVAGFWLVPGGGPGSGGCFRYTTDTAAKASTKADILAQVEAYKNDPAVLMWSVGNESILGLQNCYSGADLEAERVAYAKFVDEVAVAIHAADPNHPVSSTDAWTGAWAYYKAWSPHLDLYQVNSYGDVCSIRKAWTDGGYDRPYIVTEGGASGDWEVPDDDNGVPDEPTDIAKGAAYVHSWECVMEHENVGLGATFFHYGTEGDFGGVWFNVIPGGNKRLGYYALAKTWGKNIDAMNTPPEIQGMTVSDHTGVEAGKKVVVTLDVSDPDGDPMNYVFFYNSKYVDGAGGLLWTEARPLGGGRFELTAPQGLGVWKVYAFAEDGRGNVGVDTRTVRVVAPAVAGTNVAVGKTTTASSFDPWNGDFTPKQATDGNQATRWSSDWDDDEWIQVDLGARTTVDHVQLVWESAYAKAYKVQTSDDGTTWTTLRTVTGGDGGVDDLDLTGAGRYVRLDLDQRGTAYGYSLYELGVYHR